MRVSGRAFVSEPSTSSTGAPISPHNRGSRASSAIRASGFGARRGQSGLRKRLQSVKALVQELPVTGGEYAYASACVGPDLKVWAVPRHGEAELSRLGLSLPRNSQNRPRQGLKGITSQGRKAVRWSCRLMEDMRKRCLLYTSPSPRDKRQSRMPSSA